VLKVSVFVMVEKGRERKWRGDSFIDVYRAKRASVSESMDPRGRSMILRREITKNTPNGPVASLMGT